MILQKRRVHTKSKGKKDNSRKMCYHTLDIEPGLGYQNEHGHGKGPGQLNQDLDLDIELDMNGHGHGQVLQFECVFGRRRKTYKFRLFASIQF